MLPPGNIGGVRGLLRRAKLDRNRDNRDQQQDVKKKLRIIFLHTVPSSSEPNGTAS
jgi:hypothetical protein